MAQAGVARSTTEFSVGVEVGQGFARVGVLPAIRVHSPTPTLLGMTVRTQDFQTLSPQQTVAVIHELVGISISKAQSEIRDKGSQITLAERGLRGLGLALPDPVVPSLGMIKNPTQHLHWQDVPFERLLVGQFGDFQLQFAKVRNDANMAAYGEYMGLRQMNQNLEHMVYVVTGAGVGAGIIVNKAVYSGAHGFAGEFGHVVVDSSSTVECTGCGQRGCLDVLASGTAIARTIAKAGVTLDTTPQPPPDHALLERNGQARKEDGSVVYAWHAWQVANIDKPQVKAAIEAAGTYLGKGLLNLYHTLDPDLVVIGGIANECSIYRQKAREYLGMKLHPAIKENFGRQISQLGHDASLIGAALEAEEAWRNG